jgi:FKBP-type peptidyl-prolyl cis-trans isomerase FklB
LPIRSASARESSIAWEPVAAQAKITAAHTPTIARRRLRGCVRLDGGRFSHSVQTFAVPPNPGAACRIFVMKNSLIVLAATLLVPAAFAQGPDLKTEKDKVSYSIGLDIGTTFKKQNMDINADMLMAGVRDALSGNKPAMTEEQMKETLTAFSKSMMEKQAAQAKEAAGKNTEIGEKFLAENKTKEGVKTTASGLQYKVITEGKGESPKATDTVVTHYKGTLINGTEFDSSYKRGEPASFPVNRVIKGWTEALQMMKPGAKYQLFVPASLAYGERGAGGDIGPNETLIFEVELLEVKPGAAGDTAPAAPTGGASPSPAKADAKPGGKQDR